MWASMWGFRTRAWDNMYGVGEGKGPLRAGPSGRETSSPGDGAASSLMTRAARWRSTDGDMLPFSAASFLLLASRPVIAACRPPCNAAANCSAVMTHVRLPRVEVGCPGRVEALPLYWFVSGSACRGAADSCWSLNAPVGRPDC